MINWQYFPKSDAILDFLSTLVDVFKKNSEENDSHSKNLNSNSVLAALKTDLTNSNFQVEQGKKLEDKIIISVLFGRNGQLA
jgi:hypothetical protein